ARSGSAAAMTETVQELGIAVGVALLGSLTTALYTAHLTAPAGVAPEDADRITDSLSGALSIADRVPAEVVQASQEAFTTGINIASAVAGGAIAVAAVLCLVTLRHVRPLGEDQEAAADPR
ncbi:MFS transporter, partial [Actinoplanes sp. NPDC026670]